MTTQDQITAALRKLGPCAPAALAAELGCKRDALMYHVRAMLAVRAVQLGGTRMNRVLALPDQEIAGASPPPPQRRKPSRKKKGSGAGSKPGARPARAARPAAEPFFIPAIDADGRLVCVNGSGDPVVFSSAQTERIATLLLKHFEA